MNRMAHVQARECGREPGAQKVSFTVALPYSADAPLRPSGLLGPVALLEAVTR